MLSFKLNMSLTPHNPHVVVCGVYRHVGVVEGRSAGLVSHVPLEHPREGGRGVRESRIEGGAIDSQQGRKRRM